MSEESVMEFPCEFPIKMMGRDTPEFRATALSLVEKHVGPIAAEAIQTNLSGKGNFVSVTVTVTATSQQQLDDIYCDVSGNDDVLMAP
jgi:putative lipoic acid-binding regulatory protein